MLFAHAVGGITRAAGAKARDLDPAHRRDGLGLAMVGAALVVAGGVWWQLPGPIGDAVVAVVRGSAGSVAFLAPLLLGALGWRFLRHPERSATTGRIVIGWSALLLGILGIVHILHGSPQPAAGAHAMRHAGGLLGFFVSAPMVAGLTVYLAVPLLLLLGCFGLLVITATPVHAMPRRLAELRDRLLRRPVAPPAEEIDHRRPLRNR